MMPLAPSLSLLLALTAQARASEDERKLLLYADDAYGSLEQAAAATCSRPSEFEPRRMGELWGAQAPFVHGAQATRCHGLPSSNLSLRAEVDLAEDLFFKPDHGTAWQHLDAAVDQLVCLDGALESSLAARAWFLRGAILAARGDLEEAHAAFEQARIFEPALPWDADFGPRPMVFDRHPVWAGGSEQARLDLGPPSGARILVDGRAPQPGKRQVLLAPGLHLVQVLDPQPHSLRVQLEASQQALLIVPQALTDELARSAAQPETQAYLQLVLQALPGGAMQGAWVATGDEVWAYAAPDRWSLRTAPPSSRAVPALKTAGGGAVFGGLLATSVFGLDALWVRRAADSLEERDIRGEGATMTRSELNRLYRRDTAGMAISGGVALGGAGLLLLARRLSGGCGPQLALAPSWSPGQGGSGLVLSAGLGYCTN